MDLEVVFENFLLLSDAPSGVGRLRSLIVELAVRGKLLPREELIGTLQEAGECSAQELFSESSPHALPLDWKWSSLADLGEVNPRNRADDSLQIGFFPMRLIPGGYDKVIQCETRPWGEVKKGFTHLAEGDVVMAKITPCFQNMKSAVMRGLPNRLGAGTTELHVFRPNSSVVIPEFVLLFLKSGSFIKTGVSRMTGSAGQKRVPESYFSHTAFPLPPVDEQRRIVARVGELMALFDELEERHKKRDEDRVSLNTSALYHLTKARDVKEFFTHWQRVCMNFDLLYDKPETVEQLKQAILQLAVQGRLVPQGEDDEEAKSQLRKIAAEKEASVLAKKTKLNRNYETPSSKEIPFELPKGWEWCRLGELAMKLGAGSTPLGGKRVYTETGVMFLRSQNVWNEGLHLADVAFIPKEIHDEMSGTWVEPGDLLLNITGASIGRCAIVPDDFKEGNVSQHVAIVRLVDKSLRKYIHLCLISPYFQQEIMRVQVGVSREGLSMNRLQELLIPLAPQKMQERIIDRVVSLLSHCDRLERELLRVQTDGGMLIPTIVNAMIA